MGLIKVIRRGSDLSCGPREEHCSRGDSSAMFAKGLPVPKQEPIRWLVNPSGRSS